MSGYVADLGLAVRSDQVRQASTDLDKFVAASAGAEAASNRLSSVQNRVNEMLGISIKAGKEWTGVLAQQEQEMDRLKAKLNPLYAAQQSYAASLKEIKTAHAIGAISADEMTAAMTRTEAAFARNVVAINKQDKELANVGKAARLTSNQMLNLSRQGNDVVTMLLMGASAEQIFASQAGQIYGALEEGPGGLRGSLKAIGASILDVATRFPLITAAAGAAVVGFAAYELFAEEKIKSVDEVLKQHEANIRRLGPAYEEALKGLQKYAEESTALANLRLRTDATDALKTRADEATKAIENIVKSEGIFSSRFSGAKGAIDAFIASIKEGNPQAIRFQETIARLVESGELTEKVGQDLITASNGAYEAEQRLRGIDGQVNAVAKALSDMAKAMDNDAVSALSRLSDAQRKYVEGLIDQLKRGQITSDQFKSSLQSLSGVTPDFSGAIAQVSGLADELERANRAALGLANTTPTTRRLGAMDDAQAQYDNALNMWRRFGYDNDSKVDPNKPKKTKTDHSAERDAKAYQQVLKAADDRIKQMQTELDLMGKVGVEADALRNYQDLLAKATDRGRTVGEKQKKELHDRAEAMAKLEDATKKAKLMQDLLFDRDQMFRSSTDQIIASTMRSAGLDIDFNSPIAGAIRFNEQIATTRELMEGIASDITSGLTQALEDGKLEWKELGDIALSALSRIADKLLDMATDQLISSLLSSLFGGGSSSAVSGGSLIQDVFASAKGNVFSGPGIHAFSNQIVTKPTIFPFAKGTGLMGEAGPEGILPLRRNAQGQLGVIASANSNQPVTSNQNMHITIGWSKTADGNLKPFIESVSQGTAAQTVAAYDRQMPDRVKQIQADPRLR